MSDPVTDSQTLTGILQLAGLAGTGVLGLLMASLRRNISEADARAERIEKGVTGVASELRTLAGTVGNHGESLAEGRATFRSLQEAVKGLEDRERQRGCFGPCKHHPPLGEGG